MRKMMFFLVTAALVQPGFAADEKPRKKGARTKERVVRMLVTGYCPCKICCENWSGWNETATGDDARVCDGVAADPRLIPYRTRLRVPGVGVREVDDTGGAMRQSAKRGIYHIDVRFRTHKEARKFGRRWLNVVIFSWKRKEANGDVSLPTNPSLQKQTDEARGGRHPRTRYP